MRFKLLIFLASCISSSLFSQMNEVNLDTAFVEKERKINFSLSLASSYVWRGQSWGGNYVALQPSIDYKPNPKLTLGCWATTNFKRNYFYSDGVSANKGYHEIDFYVYYKLTHFLEVQLWDYYWPSVNKVAGIDNNYFNYGRNGVKTVDAMLCFDFTEDYQYPFKATLSTLIAGNDFRYTTDGENPRQNYTTYFELEYSYELFKHKESAILQDVIINPKAGVVFNNKAEYYTYADYDKLSFINLGFTISKQFELGSGIKMPIDLAYTHNAASKNTAFFGKNFYVVTLQLTY